MIFNASMDTIIECYSGPRVRRPWASKIIETAEELKSVKDALPNPWAKVAEAEGTHMLYALLQKDQDEYGTFEGAPTPPGKGFWMVSASWLETPRVVYHTICSVHRHFTYHRAALDRIRFEDNGKIYSVNFHGEHVALTQECLKKALRRTLEKQQTRAASFIAVSKENLARAQEDLKSLQDALSRILASLDSIDSTADHIVKSSH